MFILERVAAFLLILWIDYTSALSISLRTLRIIRGPISAQKDSIPESVASWSKSNSTNQSTLQKLFRFQGGILYKKGVLTTDELSVIKSEMVALRLYRETASSIARNRVGAVVPQDFKTVRILRDGSVLKLIQNVMGDSYHLSAAVPVELRVYEETGAGMDWHVDDVLFDPSPQIEVILTLENTSDCKTIFKIPDHNNRGSFKTDSIETDDNSTLLILSGGVSHCVTPLKRGKRSILKFAYVDASSSFRQGAMVRQFAESRARH